VGGEESAENEDSFPPSKGGEGVSAIKEKKTGENRDICIKKEGARRNSRKSAARE